MISWKLFLVFALLGLGSQKQFVCGLSLPKSFLCSSILGKSSNDIVSSLHAPLAVSAPHCISPHSCLTQLESDLEAGLVDNQVKLNQMRYGLNQLPEVTTRSIFAVIIEQFEDRLVQVLLSIALLSAVLAFVENNLHAYTEPVVIGSILLINAVVSALQSRSAESSLEALKRMQPTTATVLRNGVWINDMPAAQLVPGDIIKLRVGDRVPADARIIQIKSNSFSTDEGSLTGESATVAKSIDPVDVSASISDKSNMVFSGTVVTTGNCLAVVTGTGAGTELGRINSGVLDAKRSETKTPLQEQVDTFVSQLSSLIGLICAGVWVASIPKFSNPVFKSSWNGAAYYAKVAVALGVAAIPEGLPAVITLCLSLGTGRMARRNVIVRKLSSVETLGCTSVVCTDKTGTLTTNKMTVKSLVTACGSCKSSSLSEGGVNQQDFILKERVVEGVSYDPIGEISDFNPTMMQSEAMKMLASICAVCNEANIEFKNGVFERAGEPTEAALKVLTEKLGDCDTPRSTLKEDSAHQFSDLWTSKYTTLATLEFNRKRKSMSVLVKPTSLHWNGSQKANNYLLAKGASEMLITRCNRIQYEDGSIHPLTADMKSTLLEKSSELARRPLRCLAMAYKSGTELGELNQVSSSEEASNLPILQNIANYENLENDLILVGFCGIKDPARPEAAEAILRCAEAGIRVMMITGDSKETAVAIARDVNIFDENVDISLNAFTGKEFFSFDEEEQLKLLRIGNKVFCRTEPQDKQRLIKLLERLDEIVAMTGDGVNDAPALQQAAIGVAMGITGTEVAKSAADMVLADDNFATIVGAVEEGRNIYANMQTFICFLISSNIGEVMAVFMATVLGLPEPLTPLHLLLVNLITDGPAATALGFNPADPRAMQKLPRPRREPLMPRWLIIRYMITGLYVGFATIGAYVWWYLDKGVTLSELCNWGECSKWVGFSHTALAPLWPQKPCEIFSGALAARPQSMALSVLTIIEMLKALSAVSLSSSILRVPPWRNPWLLLGVLVPTALHFATLYTPALRNIFGLAALNKEEWKVVMMFALPILLVEESLKVVGRHLESTKQEERKRKSQPSIL